MKKIILTFLIIIGMSSIQAKGFATDTNLLDVDLLNVKTDLEDLYYKASSTGKLSPKEINTLNNIKASVDSKKNNGNTNIVPVYYKLGNVYKMINMDKEAINCYRVIVKKYPYSPIAKKAIVDLKYYGETYSNEYGRTEMIPSPDDDN